MTQAQLSFRGPVMLGVLALVGLFAGFGAWAFLARLEGAVILQGQIVVEGSRQIVQHPEGGLVAEVFVREGSRVAAGAPLLRLENPDLMSELRITEARLAGVSARVSRLIAERDGAESVVFPDALLARAVQDAEVAAEIAGQTRLFDLRLALFRDAKALLSQRVVQLRAQSRGIDAEEQALIVQLHLIQEELFGQEALLMAGLAPRAPVMALGREEARLNGQIAELAVAAAQTDGQITETELRIGSLSTERMEAAQSELREIEPHMLELDENHRALLARFEGLVLRAPESGIVLELQVPKPQVVLQAAAPVLSLVPLDGRLVITVRVRPEDIAAVFLGQSAEVAVSAFPDSAGQHLRGTVTMIAADTIADPATGTLFYAVELALEPPKPDRLAGQSLLPGMRVEVFLATRARSPMAYLLEPFTAFFDHALRES